MRACEGCRRRKIKCDAATTNTWPCSACVRLKLHCVPPMVQYDRDFAPSQVVMEQETNGDFENSSASGEEDLMQHASGHIVRKTSRTTVPGYHSRDGNAAFRTLSPSEHHGPSHRPSNTLAYPGITAGEVVEPLHFQAPVYQTQPVMRQQDQWAAESDYASAAHVSGVLGQLKIDDSGVGMLRLSGLKE
jgi:hypothetical protein